MTDSDGTDREPEPNEVVPAGTAEASDAPEAEPAGTAEGSDAPEAGPAATPAAEAPAARPGGPQLAQEAMRVAEEACRRIMEYMGFDVRVLAVPGDPVRVELQGSDAGRIIGRRGVTLQALQYLVGRIVGHRVSRHVRVKVDVEGYRVRRENALRALALRTAERVVREGRRLALEPMSAEERRVVHVALADDTAVRTESEGEGDERHVCIVPADEGDGLRPPRRDPGDGADADA